MRSVVLFESFDFNKLFSDLLFFGILKFSFHIIGSSGHKVLKLIFFLFELDFRNLLFVQDVVAFKTERFTLLDFILKHQLQFLDVCFVKFGAFESLFLEQFNFDIKASVNLPELGGLERIALLDLKGIRSDFLDFVSSFRKLFGEVIILIGQQRVLFKKGFASGFKLIDFSGADLKD